MAQLSLWGGAYGGAVCSLIGHTQERTNYDYGNKLGYECNTYL